MKDVSLRGVFFATWQSLKKLISYEIAAPQKTGLAMTLVLFVCTPIVFAHEINGEVKVDFKGREQTVTYNLYIPTLENVHPLPVLVCIGGLPMDGEKYLQSDTRECSDERWFKFAQDNEIAILGLGFLFLGEDWASKASYQFPNVWSGKALIDILSDFSNQGLVKSDELYFFGISAGAQYAVRFAQMKLDITKAVTAHAAGGYDEPKEFIPTKFLITVGQLDTAEHTKISRLEFAKQFVAQAKKKKIDVKFKIIPKITHRQTEDQNEMSRRFLGRVLKGRTYVK